MIDQVPDPGGSPVAVIGDDAVRGQEPGRPVYEHQGRPHVEFMTQVAVIVPRGDDDQAVRPPQEDGASEFPLLARVLVEAPGEYSEAASPRHALG